MAGRCQPGAIWAERDVHNRALVAEQGLEDPKGMHVPDLTSPGRLVRPQTIPVAEATRRPSGLNFTLETASA